MMPKRFLCGRLKHCFGFIELGIELVRTVQIAKTVIPVLSEAAVDSANPKARNQCLQDQLESGACRSGNLLFGRLAPSFPTVWCE